MNRAKELLSLALLPLAGVVGKRGTTVLAYHSVSDLPILTAVAPERFRAQMEMLRTIAKPVGIEAIPEILGGKSTPAPRFVVTFDDGFRDNLTVALPILKKLGIPFTVFVATGFIGKEIPAYDGKSYPALSRSELIELHREGVTVGAHTVTHPLLSRIPLDRARDEIVRSKQELEELIGAPVRFFAYPKGAFSDGVARVVQEAGFDLAVTTRQGNLVPKEGPYRLRRVSIDKGVGPIFMRSVTTRIPSWIGALSSRLRALPARFSG